MILYLSSNENEGIFDFLQGDLGIIVKKLSGYFILKQFVIYDMRSLDHYQFVAIDLKALKDTNDEIVEAITAFKKMFSSRLVIYVDDVHFHSELIHVLVEQGVYNIVTGETVEVLQKNIQKSISDIGMKKRDVKAILGANEILEEVITFNKTNIKIAVTGSMHRVGTTTTAMNLCNYLASFGARVCYVEANDHNHLKALPEAYRQMQVNGDVIISGGVKYLTLSSESEEDMDFIIYDMGVIQHKIIEAIKNKCDTAILCSGVKPYEIKELERALLLLDDINVNKLFSFVTAPERSKLNQANDRVFFAEYSPDLFDGETNKSIWGQIIEPFINKK